MKNDPAFSYEETVQVHILSSIGISIVEAVKLMDQKNGVIIVVN